MAQPNPLTNWQRHLVSWPARIGYIQKNRPNLFDFQFLIGPELTVFHAHKLIFAIASPEFEKLFYFTESNLKEIILDETKPETFQEFMNFIYFGKLELTSENVIEIFRLSKVYLMTQLTEECQAFMEKDINNENVLSFLELTNDFELNVLERNCLKRIGENSLELLKSQEFMEISRKSLEKIVKSELLTCKEIGIFDAVNEWTENSCVKNELEATSENKRMAAGDIVKQIRYETMSLEEFGKCSTGNTFLTKTEIIEIFQKLASKNVILNRRIGQLSLQKCFRFPAGPTKNFLIKNNKILSTIDFSVNQRIYLVGIGVYGTTTNIEEDKNYLHLIVTNKETVIGNYFQTLKYDSSKQIHELYFDDPLLLEPIQKYDFSITKRCNDDLKNWKGVGGKAKLEENGVIFEMSECAPVRSDNSETVSEGIIASFIFKRNTY